MHLGMLGTLNPEQKRDWKSQVNTMTHAYNSTKHDTTGMTPYLLLFGREPLLPVDISFNTHPCNKAKIFGVFRVKNDDLRQKIIFFSIAEGGAKIFGVFRVKNDDFTPKNHIFSNCEGRRKNCWGISCEKITIICAIYLFIYLMVC
jgi:hypothetical protein